MTPSPIEPRHQSRRLRGLLALVLAAPVIALAPFAPVARPAPAATGSGHCLIVHAHEVFLDRGPTDPELTTWKTAFANGSPRWSLPRSLAASDEWLSVEVTRLYAQALDRSPDAAGLAFWSGELARGVMVTRAASLIYGSPEYVNRAGGTDAAVLTDMYSRILGRQPAPAELDHWVAQRAHSGFGRIAADLVFSPESRRDRVRLQYQAVLGRSPDAAGLAYWTERLRVVNDVRLATELAASPEFATRSQNGCTEPAPTTTTTTTTTTQPGNTGPSGPIGPAASYGFAGRGWGHGRGMSQWGALGYAVDHGWSTSQILDHYYGGTTGGSLGSDPTQRVYLVGSAGTDLNVTQAAGRLVVDGSANEWKAVSVRRLSATTYRVYASTTAACSTTWTLVGDTTSSAVRVRSAVAQGDTADRMLKDCRTGRTYRGELHAVRTGGTVGNATVNAVGTEDLVRGIVPHEVSPSWANAGSGKGAAAVRAQAIAARSYVGAGDTRWGTWATTCDTATCQVYGGFGGEHSLTTTAVAATAGEVRRTANGAVARTEFASSSGGWTSGGAFPAVQDLGDSYASNGNHTWSATVSKTSVETAYPGRGSFQGFDQVVRNGLGPDGGRVKSLTLVFSSGRLSRTGDQLRSALGLKSDWWTITAR